MGLTWKENYATIFNSNTWTASVEGYKITNVFGLAWNYYIAYTKFITGLDLTMDMGMKIETFAANCYKLGYASEYKSNTFKSAEMKNSIFRVFESNELIAAASTKALNAETALIAKITRTIGTELALIEALEVAGGTSAEAWTISKNIEALDFTLLCGSSALLTAGSGIAAFSAEGLSLDGLIVEIA